MVLRRPFSPKSSLNGLPGAAASRLEPSAGCASTYLGRRRHLATTAPPRHHVSRRRRPGRPTELNDVLSALQRQRPGPILKAFVGWTKVLGDPDAPLHEASVRQAQELPATTFSEILRAIDPLLSEENDVAYGLNLSQGRGQFAHLGKWIDEFGVRRQSRRILQGLKILMALRSRPKVDFSTEDYEIMMRCAGATVDYQAAKDIWSALRRNAPQGYSQSAKARTEFIKSRFVTEPTYYQYDRARVAVMARDLYSNKEPMPMATLKRLDSMRLSMNALKRKPWNRRWDEIEEDMRRLLRRRADFRGYMSHWVRYLLYGYEVDEDFMCASIVGFARSSSLLSIKRLVFESFYGIRIEETRDPANTRISGGHDFPPKSPLCPTPRLLSAVVEAFGSMSQIALGMRLLDFLSRRYVIPIPPETWSNLLSWTYLCASKPFGAMRRIRGDYADTKITTADVRQVWQVMTSPPYNVKPTFEDHGVLIKTLVSQRSFQHAITIIHRHIMPLYWRVVSEHEMALQDEMLQSELRSAQHAIRRRDQAALYKDYIRCHLSSWLDKLLETASANKGHRSGPTMKTLIPDLILHLGDFFHPHIRYRTAHGILRLHHPDIPLRYKWKKTIRRTLPQKKAGIYARIRFDAENNPTVEYPYVPVMKLLEWRRMPRRRITLLGWAPRQQGDAWHWWRRLESEMMR